MSVLPPHFLEPISSFENSVAGGRGGGGGRNDFKKKPQHDIWHVQLDQPQKPSSKQMPSSSSQQMPLRESPAKISQLENSIAFMTKQHNEVLKSLQSEVDALKNKNRDLQFALLTSESKSGAMPPVTIPVASSSSITSGPDNRKIKSLEEEVETLKISLIESKEQNQKLQSMIEGYKRSIPLSRSKKDLNESQMSSSSPGLGSPRQSEDMDKVSNLYVEEALPFSLKPFVVHPPNGAKDRTPTLSECQAIIAQLSFHCQHQHEELTELKKNLKEALYSQKWTPDAYLIAKAIVNESSAQPLLEDIETPDRPLSADDKHKKGRHMRIPETVYSLKDHGSLPALRQTLQPGVIERQKKVSSMQKRRLRNYIVAKNAENPNNLQPQPPPPPL